MFEITAKDCNILVFDSNLNSKDIYASWIGSLGQIHYVQSGKEAVDYLGKEEVDLLIAAHAEQHGAEELGKYTKEHEEIPLIVVSSLSKMDAFKTYGRLDEFVPKDPVNVWYSIAQAAEKVLRKTP